MTRAVSKGPFLDKKTIIELKKKKGVITVSRNSEVVPIFVGKTIEVHNGKSMKEIDVTKDMLGHKFGEFSFTRQNYEYKKKKKKKKKSKKT